MVGIPARTIQRSSQSTSIHPIWIPPSYLTQGRTTVEGSYTLIDIGRNDIYEKCSFAKLNLTLSDDAAAVFSFKLFASGLGPQ